VPHPSSVKFEKTGAFCASTIGALEINPYG
jgi:hypothetical protein